MSRSTQFIGLNDFAMDYVKDKYEILSDNYTYGMFDEKIRLRKWQYVNKHGHIVTINEVVQCELWSSGPMIFTCLEETISNGTVIEQICAWIRDPSIQCELDYETGRYYV